MNVKKASLILLAVGSALVGCGGGGSVISPTPAFRANQVGDEWDFNVGIDFGIFGSYKGTMAETLISDTYNGNPAVRDTRQFNLNLQNGPATLTSYNVFSQSGTLLAEFANNTLNAVTSNTFHVPSSLTQKTYAAGTTTLDSGETISITYQVVAVERVTVPVGTFDCWVVEENITRSTGTTDTFRMWIAPQLGNYVMARDTTLNPDGTGYTYTVQLTRIVTPRTGGGAGLGPIGPLLNPPLRPH